MTVELISIGTELLLGNIVNTNAAWLAEQCAGLGLSCYYQTVVGDNPGRLEQVLSQALSRSDIVVMTGGLGPTQDDLTKETAARLTGRKLVEDAHTREQIARFFEVLHIPPERITENNWKQAMVPEGAIVLDNANGTAPGLIIPWQPGPSENNDAERQGWPDENNDAERQGQPDEKQGKHLVMLPGPPKEMIPLFEDGVRPYLHRLNEEVIYSKTVRLCGIGESWVETAIRDLIDAQDNPTIATYAKIGQVDMRVTGRARTEEEARDLVRPMVEELKRRFGDAVYTTNARRTLEQAVLEECRSRGLTLTAAESCTAGLFSATLVNAPGASDVYRQGFITYCDEAKVKQLGVRQKTLDRYTAVSRQTAAEMAEGAAAASGADAAVSITGLAGPDGGTEEIPVGTVFIGCKVKDMLEVKECHFDGNREKVRVSSVVSAMVLLREMVRKL